MNEAVQELGKVLLGNFPALPLANEALLRLATLVPVRRLAAGRTLFAQGQPARAFYAVMSGEIEARFTGPNGEISILEHVQFPRLFGLAAFAAGQASSYEALATQASRVMVFGPAAYTLLMDEVPGFARALLREFAQRYGGTLRLLEASRHRSAAERFSLALAQLLRERADGPSDAEGWQSMRASQAELAALASLSRQTTNQMLGTAVAEGYIRLGYRRIWVRPAGIGSRR
ncbi:Crp/Fnr family transcriptional regulator [Paucibacter sp. AS339]|uniref:Crp/Fnr family transcriptional regulator n=1 Tax=Paucibacter hankyongi TaxID=3133434 RepID=UPI0030A9F0D1